MKANVSATSGGPTRFLFRWRLDTTPVEVTALEDLLDSCDDPDSQGPTIPSITRAPEPVTITTTSAPPSIAAGSAGGAEARARMGVVPTPGGELGGVLGLSLHGKTFAWKHGRLRSSIPGERMVDLKGMRSWVFRNRHRLEAIYGRLAAERREDTRSRASQGRGVDAEGLVVYVLVPLPRRVAAA